MRFCKVKMLFSLAIICVTGLAMAEEVYFSEDFESATSGAAVSADTPDRWTEGAVGITGDAGVIGAGVTAGNTSLGAVFTIDPSNSGGVNAVFDQLPPQDATPYMISFDVLVDGEWPLADGGHFEVHLDYGGASDPMVCLNLLPDADRIDARSLSTTGGWETVWFQIYAADRATEYAHYDFLVQPVDTSAVLSIFRDGILLGTLEDLQNGSDSASVYLDRISVVSAAGTTSNKLYIDNITARTVTYMDENFERFSVEGGLVTDDYPNFWDLGAIGVGSGAGKITLLPVLDNSTSKLKLTIDAAAFTNTGSHYTFPIPMTGRPYTLQYDVYVNGTWDISTAAHYELHWDLGALPMICHNLLGDADRIDMRSAGNSGNWTTAWAQIYAAGERPAEFVAFDMVIEPSDTSAVVTIYRNGEQVGQLTDLQGESNPDSQYMSNFNVCQFPGNREGAACPCYVDNVKVLDGAVPRIPESPELTEVRHWSVY